MFKQVLYIIYIPNQSILVICMSILNFKRKKACKKLKHNPQAKRTGYLQALGYHITLQSITVLK